MQVVHWGDLNCIYFSDLIMSSLQFIILSISTFIGTRLSEVIDIDCYTWTGWWLRSVSGWQSKASCSDYSMLSCTAQPSNIGLQFLGTFIQNGECKSYAKQSPTYPSAYFGVLARCCNFTESGGSIHNYYSPPSSSTIDDDVTSISCQSPQEELIGCIGYDDSQDFDDGFHDFDGYFTEINNTCSARNGATGNGSSYANAICIDNANMNPGYEIKCASYWGPPSTAASEQSNVSCPADWFMTSCGAKARWSRIQSISIEDNTCIVKRLQYDGEAEYRYAQANAICCQVTKSTEEPSSMPTIAPSRDPTLLPTNDPSLAPLIITQSPTETPSQQPLSAPTRNDIVDVSATSYEHVQTVDDVFNKEEQNDEDTLLVVIVFLSAIYVLVTCICAMLYRIMWKRTNDDREVVTDVAHDTMVKDVIKKEDDSDLGENTHDSEIGQFGGENPQEVHDNDEGNEPELKGGFVTEGTDINIDEDEFVVNGDDEMVTCK
eukprot:272498_1